jgi:hypothetical protein
MGILKVEEISVHVPFQSVPFKASQFRADLPSLNDSDDIIHLDMQLVWFFKVLKGPHVSGLGLEAEDRPLHIQD